MKLRKVSSVFRKKKWHYKEYLLDNTTKEETLLYLAQNITEEFSWAIKTAEVEIPKGSVKIIERGPMK